MIWQVVIDVSEERTAYVFNIDVTRFQNTQCQNPVRLIFYSIIYKAKTTCSGLFLQEHESRVRLTGYLRGFWFSSVSPRLALYWDKRINK
jgi:hypothetical protein